MIETRNCLPDALHTPTRSLGLASLRLPAMELFHQCEGQFALATLATLWRREIRIDVRKEQEERQLDAVTFSLDHYFGYLDPPEEEVEWTSRGLELAAAVAEDYATDSGYCGEWRENMNRLADEAVTALSQRLTDEVTDVLHQAGDFDAAELLNQVRDDLECLMIETERAIKPITVDDVDSLRRASAEFLAMAEPSSLMPRILTRLRPSRSAKSWLKMEDVDLALDNMDLVNIVARKRHLRDVLRAKVSVYQRLLGSNGSGVIPSLFEAIAKRDHFRRRVQAAMESQGHAEIRTKPHEILVVQNAEAPIQRGRSTSFADLQRTQLQIAGCTPQDLANQVRKQGLMIGHERIPIGKWYDLSPGQVADQFMHQLVKPYLGSDRIDRPVNLNHPVSGLDHVLAITLTDRRLVHRIQELIPDLEKRSKPFVVTASIEGLAAPINRYLYCYPEHRRFWFDRLINGCQPVGEPDDEAACFDYRLGHPYEVVVLQSAVGLPGQTQPSFQRAKFMSKRRHRQQATRPLVQSSVREEMRLLPRRPSAYDDSKLLFQALCKCHEVTALKSNGATSPDATRYSLVQAEVTVDDLFFQHEFVAQWRPAAHFQRLLGSTEFRTFVELTFAASETFTEKSSWHEYASRLAELPEPMDAAHELCEQGILVSLDGQIFRVSAPYPRQIATVPPGLYDRLPTHRTGLTESTFVAELQRNDRLYNVCAWCVIDAMAERRLASVDVPAFIAEYVATQLSG